MVEIYHKPIIVTGIGRTGTSAVARVLHEKMGVNMGDVFKPDDWRCPDGHYEETTINQVNRMFTDGDISVLSLLQTYTIYSKKMVKRKKLWGFKDPRISVGAILGALIQFYMVEVGAFLIRCNRNKELTAKSIVRCFERTPEDAGRRYDLITKTMDMLLNGVDHLVIDMSERLSDKEIEDRIKPKAIEAGYPF